MSEIGPMTEVLVAGVPNQWVFALLGVIWTFQDGK